MVLTTKQVWERYGDGDLSELLNHVVRQPNDQREFPIGIVWKVGEQFWYAILISDRSGRKLSVDPVYPDEQWFDYCRFQRRKSAGAKA